MCMYIKLGQEPKIAEKNILCYKELWKFCDGSYTSPIRGYEYKKFRTNPIVPIEINRDMNVIHFGYHSRNDQSKRKKTNLFIIPKGTLYYEGVENNTADGNVYDNYVSETIIFVGPNNWFNRLLTKLVYNV